MSRGEADSFVFGGVHLFGYLRYLWKGGISIPSCWKAVMHLTAYIKPPIQMEHYEHMPLFGNIMKH